MLSLAHYRHPHGLSAPLDLHHAVDLQLDPARAPRRARRTFFGLGLPLGRRNRLGQRLRNHGDEDRLLGLLIAAAPRVASPGKGLRLRQPLLVRHLADRGGVTLRHDPRLRLGAPPPAPTSPGEHLHPAGDRLRQHIITRHHQHTKPVRPPKGLDSVIRSTPERYGRNGAYGPSWTTDPHHQGCHGSMLQARKSRSTPQPPRGPYRHRLLI